MLKFFKNVFKKDVVKTEPKVNKEYYYILRDNSWWQRVSKQIYDAWDNAPRKITHYELTEIEKEFLL